MDHQAPARKLLPIDRETLLGAWRLEAALEEIDGVVGPNPNMGANPTGYLHYLAEGRVCVTIALEGRTPMASAHRRTASIEDLAQSALTFDAYAGTFSVPASDTVVHHIEISSFENDVGTDLVRRVEFDGERMALFPTEFQAKSRRWLVWRKLPVERAVV